ncbi:helix-turn-helix domain-containing protein, partial [Undibacterium sp. GrIS 1.8]|uniref:helix-turn-helix domain-containing protein n=1 Tax=Undibacterium sp. GrIS 1.8 TaxID=3143934 RepID=UPI0033944009
MGMLAKIRRMYFRDKLSIREIARRTNLSRNTISNWLKKEAMQEPKCQTAFNIYHLSASKFFHFIGLFRTIFAVLKSV